MVSTTPHHGFEAQGQNQSGKLQVWCAYLHHRQPPTVTVAYKMTASAQTQKEGGGGFSEQASANSEVGALKPRTNHEPFRHKLLKKTKVAHRGTSPHTPDTSNPGAAAVRN